MPSLKLSRKRAEQLGVVPRPPKKKREYIPQGLAPKGHRTVMIRNDTFLEPSEKHRLEYHSLPKDKGE